MQCSRRDFVKAVLAGLSVALISPFRYAIAGEMANTSDVVFLTPQETDFVSHRQIFNKRITLMPAVIAVCFNEQGVQKAVSYAIKNNLTIAVKSGGHGFEGFALNDGGLVIDLSAMNSLLLQKNNVLQAEPAVKLRELYNYLLPKKRLVPAGSCGGVGLAGLTLGGGYGMFSRQYGLTCDNLIRVKMIDGTGQLRDSNKEPELLWACRGGNNGSLGVVTHFEYKTYDAPAELYSFRVRHRPSTVEAASEIVSRWFGLMPALPKSAYSALIMNSNTITILVTSHEDHQNSKFVRILEELKAGTSDEPSISSLPLATAVTRYYGRNGPLYFKNVSAGFYSAYEDIKAVLPNIAKIVRQQPGVIFQVNTFGPLPKNEAAAFPHYSYAYIGELQAYWDKPEQEPEMMDTVKFLQQDLSSNGIRAHYANYPDLNISEWATAYYGEEHYKKLQNLKKIYDPHNQIKHPQSIELPSAV